MLHLNVILHYPADHDHCHFLSVLLVDQITDIGNEMCSLTCANVMGLKLKGEGGTSAFCLQLQKYLFQV